MSWSPTFLSAIAQPRLYPRFLLESVEDSGFDPGVAPLKLSSHGGVDGYTQAIAEGGNLSASLLGIGEWTGSASELTIPLTKDVRDSAARGIIVVFRVGFAGWPESDYEAVFAGQIQSLDEAGPNRWSMTVRSIVGSLTSRLTQDIDYTGLFGACLSTDIAAGEAYNAVGGVGPATITLTDAESAGAESDPPYPGNYLVQVVPDAGDPFLLRVSAPTFASTDLFTAETGAILGTTASSASPGATVNICGYIQDHPVDVARKVLVSTGVDAANGPYDTLPETWGLGIPTFMVDDDDIDLTLSISTPSGVGTPLWDVYSVGPQEDGLAWLNGVLSPAGVIICERQGQITIRAVFPAYEPQYETVEISDHDIVSIERRQTWDSSVPIEFAYILVSTPPYDFLDDTEASETFEELDSRPGSYSRSIQLPYVGDDVSDWRRSVIDRLSPWSTRLPETIEMTLLGLRYAYLAPCDSIVLDTRYFRTRDQADLPTLMVLSVQPDWWMGGVRVVAAYIPADPAES